MGEIASPAQLRLSLLRWALVTVPLILLLGVASGRLAGAGMENPWFAALAKPAFMPPGWVFPLAWSLLYVLMGFALAIILHARRARGRKSAIGLFMVQLALNLAWSPMFFAAHQVTFALGLLIAVLVTAAATAILFARIRASAGMLMLPYVAWLVFAALLNYEIDRLNPDAEVLAPSTSSTQISL
jgi:tryptophan-rich sensory protein